jgi:hypothetical protein
MAAMKGISPATTDLGLGDQLPQQVQDETEEERKRRALGLSPMLAQSPAVASLFGLGGARGRGY